MVTILYVILVFATQNEFFIYFGIWLMLFYSISNLSLDESCGWGRYARTLPVSDVQIIGAKFLVSGCYVAAGLLYGLIIGGIAHLIFEEMGSFLALVIASLVVTLVASLIVFAMYPFALKFGLEKTRNATFVVWMVVFGGFLLFGEKLNQVLPLDQVGSSILTYPIVWAAGVSAAGILLIVLCFVLSVRIYRKKEF